MANGTFSAVAARPSGWLASTDIVALVEGALAGFDPAAAHLLAEVDEAGDQHGLPLEGLAAGSRARPTGLRRSRWPHR